MVKLPGVRCPGVQGERIIASPCSNRGRQLLTPPSHPGPGHTSRSRTRQRSARDYLPHLQTSPPPAGRLARATCPNTRSPPRPLHRIMEPLPPLCHTTPRPTARRSKNKIPFSSTTAPRSYPPKQVAPSSRSNTRRAVMENHRTRGQFCPLYSLAPKRPSTPTPPKVRYPNTVRLQITVQTVVRPLPLLQNGPAACYRGTCRGSRVRVI